MSPRARFTRLARSGMSPALLAAALISLCGPAGAAPAKPAGPRPSADLAQEAALEAARQDLVETQLEDLVARFDALIEDLASNRDVGSDLSAAATALRDRLTVVRRVRVGHARKRIDEAMRTPAAARERLADAQRQIALAARELGSLLLQAGISHACEVAATELREILARQEALHASRAGRAAAPAGTPAEAQTDLATRTETLLGEIGAVRESPADALASVRLARARKVVESAQVVPEMRRAAADWSAAAGRQDRAIRGLRQGLLKLRPDARLQELVRARNLVREILDAQKALRADLAALVGAEWEARREGLSLRQEALVRPLQALGGTHEIETPVDAALQAGRDAAAAIASGGAPGALAAQGRVESALSAALLKLGDLIAKLNALGETHRRMLEAAERLKGLIDLRDRAEQVKNAAFDAATAGKSLDGAAGAQRMLAQDLEAYAKALPETSKYASAMRKPLRKAAQAVEASAHSMKIRKLDAALPDFLKAEQRFKEAIEIAKRDVGVLEKLWLFQQASADLAHIRQAIEDVEGEQADLRAGAEAARKAGKAIADLAGPQASLARAVQQVQEFAAAIREASAMKEPLDAAAAAMGQAAGRLEKNQAEPAETAQQQAIAALRNARAVASGLIRQIDLLVIEIDAASELSSRAMDLLQRQIALRETTEEAPEADFGRLAGEQDILLAETTVLTSLTVAPKAAEGFTRAAAAMTAAIGELKAVRREPAVDRMKAAEEALRAGILALDEYILSLMALAQAGSGIVQQYLTAFDGLTALLLLATEQRELRELTHRSPDAVLPAHAETQEGFRERAIAISKMPNVLTLKGRITGWEHVEAAAAAMEKAVKTLKASVKPESVAHMQTAEKELRIAFAMNVVEVINALRPPPPNAAPGTKEIPLLQDRPTLLSIDHWMEFSKASPSGKAAQGGKAEWSSLVDRERAALNENFARELPLEFRKLLKDYYEALAK